MRAIYLRVSKEDLDESTQLPEILRAFGLKESDCLVFRERVSAYQADKQKDRLEFIALKKLVEEGKVNEVYVYSLERFERDLKRMLEFYFFCEVNNCTLYSALQPYLNNLLPKSVDKQLMKNPVYQFLKYLMVLIYGFLAENESFFTSQRTRKTIRVTKGVTMSKDANKWGGQFTTGRTYIDEKGQQKQEIKKLSVDEILKLENRVVKLLTEFEAAGEYGFYDKIIAKVKKEFDLVLSKAYITKLKKRSAALLITSEQV